MRRADNLEQSEVEWAAGRTLPRRRHDVDHIAFAAEAEAEVGLFFGGTARQEPSVVPMSPTPQVPSMGSAIISEAYARGELPARRI